MAETSDRVHDDSQPIDWAELLPKLIRVAPRVVRCATKCVLRSHDVEDIVQEAALRIHQKLAGVERCPTDDPLRWAAGFIRLIALEEMRKRRNADLIPDFDVTLLVYEGLRQEIVDGEDQLKAFIKGCRDKLRPRAREFLDRWTETERGDAATVASALGVSVGAFQTAATKARAKLSECVNRQMRAKGERA